MRRALEAKRIELALDLRCFASELKVINLLVQDLDPTTFVRKGGSEMSVGRICVRDVDLANPDEPVQKAAQRMHARNVGTLMVLDPDSRPVGILTDRDLATRVVAKGLDAYTTTVREVMSDAPRSVREDTTIEMALSQMRSGPFRRLPVTDANGELVGLVSIDDVLDLLSGEFTEIGRLIRNESPSTVAGG